MVPVTNNTLLPSALILLYYYQMIKTKYRHRVSVIVFHNLNFQDILTLEDEVTMSFATSETTQLHSIISQKTRLLSGIVIHHYIGKADTYHTPFGKSRGNRNSKSRPQRLTSVHILYICAALTSCDDPTKTVTCCASVWLQ